MIGDSATYGKGKIQSVYELADGSALFVTIARYKTPVWILVLLSPTHSSHSRHLEASLRFVRSANNVAWGRGGKHRSAAPTLERLRAAVRDSSPAIVIYCRRFMRLIRSASPRTSRAGCQASRVPLY